VIVYAMYVDLLDSETIGKIAEDSMEQYMVAHERIGPDSDMLLYQIKGRETRGVGNRQFRLSLYDGHETHWDLDIRIFGAITDDSKINRYGSMGTGLNYWYPFQSIGAMTTNAPIPVGKDHIVFRIPIEYVLSENGEERHRWSVELRHEVVRLGSEPEYIEVETNQAVGSDVIEGLFISELMVPTDVVEMAKHNSIKSTTFLFATIENPIAEDLSLMGTIHYRIDDQEIAGQSIIAFLDSQYCLGIGPQYSGGESGWLKPYIDQIEFWERAVQRGKIDVVYRPDPSLAEMNPGHKKILGIPFIFKDVPVKGLIPEQVSTNRAGVEGMEWRYINRFSNPAPPKTGAEALDE